MKNKAKALFAGSLLLGGLAFGLSGESFDQVSAQTLTAAKTQVEQRQDQIKRERSTFAQLAKDLNPTVVNISVVKRVSTAGGMRGRIPEEFRRMLPEEMRPQLEQPREREASGQGSGVIISADGDILTNNHVVEGADEITVTLHDGRELDARIVGRDSNTDLALLKVENSAALPTAQLGNSDQLEVGDWVMAIGNPFGLEATVTVGVLSGKGRVIGAGPYDDFLQTDTSINPGNSGGPLFNVAGEVVGINTAIIRGGQGIGFSIPINLAKDISKELKENGRVERGFIGVGIQTLNSSLKKALGIDPSVKGALVSSVLPDGPAKEAGVQVSDVIVAVNGQRLTDDKDLLREVAKLDIGSLAPITVVREGTERTLNLRIARRPNDGQEAQESPRQSVTPEKDYRVGVMVTDQGPEGERGVFVAEVVPGSPASRAGLRRGDNIRAVGKTFVSNSQEFTSVVNQTNSEEIALLVERNGRTSYVLIED